MVAPKTPADRIAGDQLGNKIVADAGGVADAGMAGAGAKPDAEKDESDAG